MEVFIKTNARTRLYVWIEWGIESELEFIRSLTVCPLPCTTFIIWGHLPTRIWANWRMAGGVRLED